MKRSAASSASSKSFALVRSRTPSATSARICSARTGTSPRRSGRLTADPGRPIGEALLDQRNLAGIGNIYKTETLFLRRVSPWRPVGQVDELAELVELARQLLEANKERIGQVTTADTRPGRQNWIYGRAGRPCRRCGTAIRQASQGPDLAERITYWCPRCQPD